MRRQRAAKRLLQLHKLPFVVGADETMAREESKKNRTIALSGRLPVCSLMHQVDKLTVDYIATHEIDYKPVYDHRTGE